MIKFSVIVPLYNKVAYIERTLNSILSQSFSDFELVVVDDGSTDGSALLAENILKDYSAFCKVVRQPNAGVAVARNHGVELAIGQYVCFLDADDWWEPDFLEEMSALITQYPDAGFYGTNFYLVKNGKRRIAPIGVSNGFRDGYINYCKTYANTLCMPISSSSVAILKSAFYDAGQFRKGISLGEDFDLWIRLALKYKVVLVNKPLANYFQDIPVKDRATRRLHIPQNHMLWNLDYLSDEEERNLDLKVLLDRLRVSGLWRYYLSRQYHEEALIQLQKVDWKNVDNKYNRIYHTPLYYQRIKFNTLEFAATIKNSCILKLLKLTKSRIS